MERFSRFSGAAQGSIEIASDHGTKLYKEARRIAGLANPPADSPDEETLRHDVSRVVAARAMRPEPED